ncbi:MAG TPA: ABC transporter permease [Thermodesulfobacteriota bacterium]|nr:ABC transporter permease [Thermodesulfobacteriota bacterium]
MRWWIELRKNWMAQGSLLFVVAIVGMALLAPVFGFDIRADEGDLERRNLPPFGYEKGSAKNLLGCDAQGRDILSRVIFGARTSLFVAVVAVSIATFLGVAIGLVAGYYGGKVDDLIMRVVDAVISIPGILLTLIAITLWNPGVLTVAVFIGLTHWVWQARTARSKILSLREEPFIVAARVSGASDFRIIFRHIVPNIRATILVVMTTQIGYMIIIESSLSFFGMTGSTISWGWDISQGRDYLSTAWWITSMPGIAILLTVISFNILGDWLRDALDPHLRV